MNSGFLPTTLASWAAIAAAGGAVVAAAMGFVNRKRIQEVHILVNSNLTEIKQQLQHTRDERDSLLTEKTELDKTKGTGEFPVDKP